MTEDVLIKEVEGHKIWLKEEMIEKQHASKIMGGFFITCCIITAAWIWLWFVSNPLSSSAPPDALSYIVLLFGVLSAVGIIAMLLIKNSYCLAYVIHTTGVAGIVIFKTTPEADQVAVCRAAQELEIKIKETIKEKRALEAIAGRCK